MSGTANGTAQRRLLDAIEWPHDLRQLPASDLPRLCDELRAFLIESVARCGGHFAAGLGAVELTVALHYVFDTPRDVLVWDVGHQCYPHKILTGRKREIESIRRRGGLAPFPKRGESDYDSYGVGHSSTSIGAAAGMAAGFDLLGERRKVAAVIGDGGMTAGMAYEALNHLGDAQYDVLIVLNDNEMSISPNVGAMSNYLTRILSSPAYTQVIAGGRRLLEPLPPVSELARRTKEHIKGMIVPGTMFEELNVHYYGPVDGHNVSQLVKTLGNLKKMSRPRLLHVITRKGKGYAPAEQDPVGYHAVPAFDPAAGVVKRAPPASAPATYTAVFSRWVCDMAARDPRLVAITPAMREGSGLVEFERRFPKRYFDVGIAEQHALTLAAGMACAGLKPVVAIYSTFLQRGYDQFIHDIALQKLPVVFAIDRAGVVGADGQTHAGSFDLSFLRCIPGTVVMTPMDERMTRKMLSTAFSLDAPAAVRYPRGQGPGADPGADLDTIEVGKAAVLRRGRGGAILGFGSPVAAALEAAEKLDASVVDMRFVKPLDEALLREMAAAHDWLATVEDNVVAGGAGGAVNECLAAAGAAAPVLNLGLPDTFQDHASREEQLHEARLDADGIERDIRAFIGRMTGRSA